MSKQYNKFDDNFFDKEIRSHLNTSLEQDGISVSEELIHRTLEAIKKESNRSEDSSKINHRNKIVSWKKYATSIAALAAAAIILVAGSNWMSSIGSKDSAKNDSKSSELDRNMADMRSIYSGSDGSSMEENGIEMAKDDSSDFAAFDSVEEGIGKAEEKQVNMEVSLTAAGVPESEVIDEAIEYHISLNKEKTKNEMENELDQDRSYLSFKEISGFELEDIRSLKITADEENIVLILEDYEQVKDFFDRMEDHQFEPVTDSTLDVNTSKDQSENMDQGIWVNILIGESFIKVQSADEDRLKENTYQSLNYDGLKATLKSFIQEYNN